MASNSSPRLIAHWPLQGDTRDRVGHLHAAPHNVALGPQAASFNGTDALLEVADDPLLHFKDQAFTLSAWVYTEPHLGGMVGDIVSKFDHATRRGFHLGIIDHAGVTYGQGNYRHLQFGIDGATEPAWQDCGRPGNASQIFALAAHEGQLYAGTYEHGENEVGHVYRLVEGRWQDCGLPNRTNAVSSLVGFGGHLYAATGRYDARGSSIGHAGNLREEMRVWRLEHSGAWTDCGAPPGEPDLLFLGALRDRLYAVPNYRVGLYRMDAPGDWTARATPYPRFLSVAQWRGCLYGASNRSLRQLGPPPARERIFIPLPDADGVYRYDADTDTWHGCGKIEQEDQMYSFAVHRGELHVGTWPTCKVFASRTGEGWVDCGRLHPDEKEVMAMAVYNGALYAGTLPAADVYRMDARGRWAKAGSTDQTPGVKYRRAWSMAVHDGQLFVGTLPSGHVHAMRAGCVANWSYEWPAGWRHVTAVRTVDRLELYCDGKLFSESRHQCRDIRVDNQEPLRIGLGPHDYFHGRMRDVRIFAGALDAQGAARLHADSPPIGG